MEKMSSKRYARCSVRSQSPALLSLLIACKFNMGILKRTVNICIYLNSVIFQAIEAQAIDCALSIQHRLYDAKYLKNKNIV
jgi:hypothetical protein